MFNLDFARFRLFVQSKRPETCRFTNSQSRRSIPEKQLLQWFDQMIGFPVNPLLSHHTLCGMGYLKVIN